mmetsp:Transcript_19493/g.19787  ORF Transcript_19493/g.19787 Transcript_19493/m.19787 type:complete len:90 (+) Transcript_19493:209-478(+)
MPKSCEVHTMSVQHTMQIPPRRIVLGSMPAGCVFELGWGTMRGGECNKMLSIRKHPEEASWKRMTQTFWWVWMVGTKVLARTTRMPAME